VGATGFDDCVAGFQSVPWALVSRKRALEECVVTNSHFLCPNGPEARFDGLFDSRYVDRHGLLISWEVKGCGQKKLRHGVDQGGLFTC